MSPAAAMSTGPASTSSASCRATGATSGDGITPSRLHATASSSARLNLSTARSIHEVGLDVREVDLRVAIYRSTATGPAPSYFASVTDTVRSAPSRRYVRL